MRTKASFQWKPFLKRIALIGIPVALQNVLTTTGSMVDTMMIASLGEQTVGAVGLCSQFTNLIFGSFWGFVAGGMLFIAQYFGAKDEKGMRASYGIMWALCMTVGLIACFFTTFFPDQVMALYTDKKAIQQIGSEYIHIVGFQFPFMIFSVAAAAFLRSTGRVRIPLVASIASVVLNVCLNYVLINGKLGFPVLGAKGAAIATVIAQMVNLLVCLVASFITGFRSLFAIRDHFRWTRDFLKLFFKRSFPLLCNELMIAISGTVISIIFGRQSEEAIAAYAVISVIEGLYLAFFAGFANSSAVMVGNAVGAGKLRLGYEYGKRLVILCLFFIALVDVPVLLLKNQILTAMGLSGKSFEIGTQMVYAFSVIMVIRLDNWMHNDTIRSAGDSVFGTVIELSFMFAMVLPLLYVSAFVWKLDFIWLFIIRYIDEPIRIVIMYIHLFSGKWMRPVTPEGKAALPAFFEELGHSASKK